jgi:hypothetical protein
MINITINDNIIINNYNNYNNYTKMQKFSIHQYIVFIQNLCAYKDNYQYSREIDLIISNVPNNIEPYLFGETYNGNNPEIITELDNIMNNLVKLLKKIKPNNTYCN